MMLVAAIIVLSMASLSFAVEDRCVFNPVMNFGKCACSDGDTSDSSTETTQLVKELFDDLSTNLISQVEQNLVDHLAEASITFKPRPRDCSDVKTTESGIYTIYPDGMVGYPAYCDMDTAGGGWTVIQRREDGSEDFYRKWDEYMVGFGDLEDEFWFGNQLIHALVSSGWFELRIDMVGPDGYSSYYAGYDMFEIAGEKEKYALNVRGYHGDAGDHLVPYNGYKFSTRDQDNDASSGNCAVTFTGAWWYKACHQANLNGKYGDGGSKGIHWKDVSGHDKSLPWVEMKIRPWRKH